MSKVIIISGPIGAGKSTVARELVPMLPGLVASIEGDKFWTFLARAEGRSQRDNFTLIMRAMTAASIPFARSGFDVVLDFSVPPQFLEVARKILKELPAEYVILRPSVEVCAARAAARPEGAIVDYTKYLEFYRLFEGFDQCTISDDTASPVVLARRIREGLESGKFPVL